MNELAYLPSVREQYENYPYPKRDPADEKTRLVKTYLEYLSKINYYCYEGKQTFLDGFRVLVVGGGTGDATIYMADQLKETNAEIVYLDISSASMAIAKERAEIRGLTNIDFRLNSIYEIPELELGQFDYINSSGMLHHLEDPPAALQILADSLAEGGAIGCMVYAPYGRTGIYQMQSLMQLMNASEEDMQVKVDNTKKTLGILPDTNWFKRDLGRWNRELQEFQDIAIYDMFLHSRDRSYSVPELYELADSTDLVIVEFVGKKVESAMGYSPEFVIGDPDLLKKVEALPKPQQQAICELVSGHIRKHNVYFSKREGTIAQPECLENIPLLIRYKIDGLFDAIDKNPGQRVTLNQSEGVSISFQPRAHTKYFFKYLDGKRTLADIFKLVRSQTAGKKPTIKQLLSEFNEIFGLFVMTNWMFLRHESVRDAWAEQGLDFEF